MLTLTDLESLVESTDVECKAARGKSGEGAVPDSFWETYSAMANTKGGIVYLGIEEKPASVLHVVGIQNVEKMLKALWDTLNAGNKVSKNILEQDAIAVQEIEGKRIIEVTVSRARRKDRPIYIGQNPLKGTFVRRHEGDYHLDEEEVRRMTAEAVEDSRDETVLPNFRIADLDMETILSYRNRFAALKPGSPWLDVPVEDFLLRIGAIQKNRSTGTNEVRRAGLLMFGRFDAIHDVYPYYFVDYQERLSVESDERWSDRLVPDGDWSGNLYDYFQRVYRKLIADVKIPFRLSGATRIDDTPIHEALRETLANTLIHADYTGRVSVLVEKYPDRFIFRNPGPMRVSLEQALAGGISDCRNRNLQNMFRYVGYGDHAGSGIPKILRNWHEQHWQVPFLMENNELGFTKIELRMISLFPEETHERLLSQFGSEYSEMPERDRIILVTTAIEGMVTHKRVMQLSSEHPKDITARLCRLVQDGFLLKTGETRARVYYLPSSPDKASSSPDKASSSPDKASSSPDSTGLSVLVQIRLDAILSSHGWPRFPGRLAPSVMRSIILDLCTGEPLELRVLAKALVRDPKGLYEAYLNPMISEGLLELKYPASRNHPNQAYRTK